MNSGPAFGAQTLAKCVSVFVPGLWIARFGAGLLWIALDCHRIATGLLLVFQCPGKQKTEVATTDFTCMTTLEGIWVVWAPDSFRVICTCRSAVGGQDHTHTTRSTHLHETPPHADLPGANKYRLWFRTSLIQTGAKPKSIFVGAW